MYGPSDCISGRHIRSRCKRTLPDASRCPGERVPFPYWQISARPSAAHARCRLICSKPAFGSDRPAAFDGLPVRRCKSLANRVWVKEWDRCRASETIDIAGQLGADAAVSCGGGNFADAGYGAGTHESGPSRPLLRSASKVYKT